MSDTPEIKVIHSNYEQHYTPRVANFLRKLDAALKGFLVDETTQEEMDIVASHLRYEMEFLEGEP